MLRLAAYARVSTDEQSTIEAQLGTLEPLARQLGGVIVETLTDVLSGLDSRRPGYQRLLDLARRGKIDGVLVYKLDRFGRDHGESIRAVNELERLGVRVYSATEPTEDPFVRDLLLLLANRETRVLSERVKLGQRDRARQGQWQGRPPTGYRLVKSGKPPATFTTLEPDSKGPLLTRLFELAAAGDYTVRELRDQANLMGLTSGTGRELTRAHVHKLLTNPAYVGDVYYGRQAAGKFEAKRHRARDDWTVVENAHPPLTDRETFAQVQAVFAQHLRIQGDARKTAYLLTSLIYCAGCRSRMYGVSHGKGRNGRSFHSYCCSRHQSYGLCDVKVVGGIAVDDFVRAEISRFVVTDGVRRRSEVMIREREEAREAEANAQRRNLSRQRQKIEAERQELAENYMLKGRGVVPYEVYARIEAEKVQAIAIIDRALSGLGEAQPLDVSREIAMLELARWDEVEVDDPLWRGAVVLLIERIDVKKGAERGKPVVAISWTPAARLIREAVGAFPTA